MAQRIPFRLFDAEVRDKLASLGVDWDAQGSGWVVAQEPGPGTSLTEVPLCHLVFSNTRNAPTETPAPNALKVETDSNAMLTSNKAAVKPQ